MEIIRSDVAIIGAGGAGLRAAIALAQTDPALTISLISKVYPMRSHTCAAEGGAAGVIKPDDSLDHHLTTRLAAATGCAIRMPSITWCRKRRRNCCSLSTGDARGAGSLTARWRCARLAA